jgi:hypothetical protein
MPGISKILIDGAETAIASETSLTSASGWATKDLMRSVRLGGLPAYTEQRWTREQSFANS